MSRSLFENSKAALAFAAITIIGAVSMVGTSERGGMLPAVMERFGAKVGQQADNAQISSEAPQGGDDAESPAAAPPPSVFGDADVPMPQVVAPPAPQNGNPMTAPLAPDADVLPRGVRQSSDELVSAENEAPFAPR